MSKTPDLKRAMLVPVFAAMTVVGAYIVIPLPWSPVPIVLQNFFILLSGLVLGGARGAASSGLYILLGVFGLPVFAGGKGGVAVFAGPTAGYLLSYPLAALTAGLLASSNPRVHAGSGKRTNWRRFARDFAAALAGVAVVYAVGFPWLKLRLGLPWGKALAAGLLPFIAGDVFKAAAAAILGAQVRGIAKEEGAGDEA